MTPRVSRYGFAASAAAGLLLCLSLAACGGSGDASAPTSPPTGTTPPTTTPEQPAQPEQPAAPVLKCAP